MKTIKQTIRKYCVPLFQGKAANKKECAMWESTLLVTVKRCKVA